MIWYGIKPYRRPAVYKALIKCLYANVSAVISGHTNKISNCRGRKAKASTGRGRIFLSNQAEYG